jgi:hypothetical protein
MTQTAQLAPASAATPAASPTHPGVAAHALLAGVWVYQQTLSPLLPALFGPSVCGCRFHPTCSHYAAGAVRTHGALAGSWLAARRLLKCTPLHSGGNDPVPARRDQLVGG